MYNELCNVELDTLISLIVGGYIKHGTIQTNHAEHIIFISFKYMYRLHKSAIMTI